MNLFIYLFYSFIYFKQAKGKPSKHPKQFKIIHVLSYYMIGLFLLQYPVRKQYHVYSRQPFWQPG